MKVASVHERRFDATPRRLAALVADVGAIWPTQIAPAPHAEGAVLNVGRIVAAERPGASWTGGRTSARSHIGDDDASREP